MMHFDPVGQGFFCVGLFWEGVEKWGHVSTGIGTIANFFLLGTNTNLMYKDKYV